MTWIRDGVDGVQWPQENGNSWPIACDKFCLLVCILDFMKFKRGNDSLTWKWVQSLIGSEGIGATMASANHLTDEIFNSESIFHLIHFFLFVCWELLVFFSYLKKKLIFDLNFTHNFTNFWRMFSWFLVDLGRFFWWYFVFYCCSFWGWFWGIFPLFLKVLGLILRDFPLFSSFWGWSWG